MKAQRALFTVAAISVLSLATASRADDEPKAGDAPPAGAKAASAQPAKPTGGDDGKARSSEKTAAPPPWAADRPAADRTGSGGMHDCGSSLSMKGHP